MADVLCPLPHHHDPDRPRQADHGAYLCPGHAASLGRNIADLPVLYDDLALRLATTGAAAEPVGGTRDPGIALNEAAADTRARIRATLASWCRVVVEDRGLNGPPTAEPQATGPWLAGHADWLAAQQDIAHIAATEIAELRARAWSLAYPSGRRRIDVGPCLAPGCPGALVAYMAAVDDQFPSALRCDLDEAHTLTADRWRELRRRHLVLLTTAEASHVYGVPQRTIRQWWADGRLTRHGTDTRAKWDMLELDQLTGLRNGGSHLPKSG